MKTVIKYLQFPFAFSVEKLCDELNALSAQWVLHFNKAHFDGEWSAIPLRSLNGTLGDIFPENRINSTFQDTILMEQCPYIKSILEHFPSEFKTIRLLKLAPGAIIKEHKDAELAYEYGEARIHIPILTNPDVEFYLDNERVDMKPGECWYMNFDLPHRIINKSATNRIHLVFDIVVNDRIREMFEGVTPEMEKIIPVKEQFSTSEKMNIIRRLREMNTPVSLQLAATMEAENE